MDSDGPRHPLPSSVSTRLLVFRGWNMWCGRNDSGRTGKQGLYGERWFKGPEEQTNLVVINGLRQRDWFEKKKRSENGCHELTPGNSMELLIRDTEKLSL